MDGQRRFAVIGTDARLAAAGRALARAGFAVGGPEQTALADYILLPLPLDESRTPLAELLRAAKPGALALGGKLSAQARQIAAEAGVELVDYFAREELAVANAVPTAEGAVQLAMEQMPVTIHGARVLITGFGRVGQAAARRFAALGARVSVAARRYEQLALAESEGYGAEQIGGLDGWLCGYDLVVNTVPALVLGEAELADLKPDCLVLDLASKPGGVDLEAAGRLGRTVIWALSLPGKVAPVTAGSAIKNTIYHMLHELGA